MLSLAFIIEVFMGFVKSYIQLFAYGSVTTEEWKNYLFTYFKDKEPLPLSHVKKMQEVYQLNSVKNAEVRFREVYNFSKYSDEAVKTFKEHRGALHAITAMLVAKDLKIDG
ncbi:Leukotriene A-4 hydrolase [Anabarilius grahami]|uniref:Leukotriene A-4 hydrolase n=1 Tax=Anabarilius grahami TaxID=495550 RepID=A0A3N0XD17_ANAGA|nr:Leukotriene A-4 hydrolase [Anabarilius grahami]